MTRGQRHRTRGHGHGGKRSPGCRVGGQIKSSIRFGFFMKNASSSPHHESMWTAARTCIKTAGLKWNLKLTPGG